MSGISNHYDTLTAIKTLIDGLSLSGLTGGTVIQEVATYQDGQSTLPFVSISPYGPERIPQDGGLNDRDECDYGVLVAIIAKPDVNTLETRLGWRQKMRRHLNNADPVANGQSYNMVVEPGSVVEPKAWFDRNAFVSGFVIRAKFQEVRT
jgi:hypothetical protein